MSETQGEGAGMTPDDELARQRAVDVEGDDAPIDIPDDLPDDFDPGGKVVTKDDPDQDVVPQERDDNATSEQEPAEDPVDPEADVAPDDH